MSIIKDQNRTLVINILLAPFCCYPIYHSAYATRCLNKFMQGSMVFASSLLSSMTSDDAAAIPNALPAAGNKRGGYRENCRLFPYSAVI